MGLGHELKTTYWSELKTVYSTIKEIAEEIRQDYRRKIPALVSTVSHEFIKDIIAPLSCLVRDRYSDEKTEDLLGLRIAAEKFWSLRKK